MSPPDNKLPQRKSPRLEGYDYSQNGAYFITICVQNRLNLLGKIVKQEMILNDAGQMIQSYLQEIPTKFGDIEPDLFVVMPNHIHVIIVKTSESPVSNMSSIVQWLKRITTNQYIRGVKQNNWRRFNKRLWQQSFYDHIIRNENALKSLREYVLYNPQLWEKDEFFED